MKKILFVLMFVCSTAYAQPGFIVNDDLSDLGVSEGFSSPASVDSFGIVSMKVSDPTSGLSQSVIPVSNATAFSGPAAAIVGYNNWEALTDTIEAASTTTVLNLTAHVGRVGDIVLYRGSGANLGVESPVCSVTTNTVTLCKALPATPGLDSIVFMRPMMVGVSYNRTNGGALGPALNVNMDWGQQYNPATGLLKLEDAAAASGDALVGIAGVINNTLAAKATDGDYTSPSLDSAGAVIATLVTPSGLTSTFSPIRAEDAAFTDSNALMVAGSVYRSYATTSASSVGDVVNIQSDVNGGVFVNAFGSAPAQFVQGCSSAITTATTGTMIAADADEKYYITGWNCTNTGGAATRVVLEDSDGNDYANTLLAATTGSQNLTFPTPLLVGAFNKAVQINVITTGTSTICCANGYKNVN